MGLKSRRPPKKGGKKKEEVDDKTEVSTVGSSSEGESSGTQADQLASEGIIATYSQVP